MQFDPQDRIRAYSLADPNSGCWLWMTYVQRNGYARCSIGGSRSGLAHRLSYQAFRGAIPDGLQLDHKCRTRSCVNPDHLEPVTAKENARRGMGGKHHKNRTHCPKGHPYTAENTALQPAGGRVCIACRDIGNRERYLASRVGVAPKRHGKLTAEQVAAIRASKESERAIARRFGISCSTAHSVKSGQSWRTERG